MEIPIIRHEELALEYAIVQQVDHLLHTQEGMTRPGSAAANGIAPSVINENPRIQFETPARRSSLV